MSGLVIGLQNRAQRFESASDLATWRRQSFDASTFFSQQPHPGLIGAFADGDRRPRAWWRTCRVPLALHSGASLPSCASGVCRDAPERPHGRVGTSATQARVRRRRTISLAPHEASEMYDLRGDIVPRRGTASWCASTPDNNPLRGSLPVVYHGGGSPSRCVSTMRQPPGRPFAL